MQQEFEYGEPVEVRNEGGVWVVRKYIGIKYFTRVNTWDDEYQEWDEIRKLPEHTATEGLIDIEQPETISPSASELENDHLQEQVDTLDYLIRKLTEAVDSISNRVGIVMQYHEGLRKTVNEEQKKTAFLYQIIDALEKQNK